jgi:hypothetical protein
MPDIIDPAHPIAKKFDEIEAHIDAGNVAHQSNVTAIAKNTGDVATAKISAYVSGAIAVITAIGLLITQLAPMFAPKPGPIQVVNCPCSEKVKPVLIDPALLTPEQLKAIAPLTIPDKAVKPGPEKK